MAGLGHGSWPWSAMVMVMGHGLHDDDVSMMMMFDVVRFARFGAWFVVCGVCGLFDSAG